MKWKNFTYGTQNAGWTALLLLFLSLTHPLTAQTPDQTEDDEIVPATKTRSRAEEIRKARDGKAARVEAEQTTGLAKRLNKLAERNVLDGMFIGGGTNGFQPVIFGGLRSGGGFSYGAGYKREDWARGNVHLRTSARVSLSLGYLFDFQFGLPKLAKGKLFFDFLVVHENSPKLDYYGPGPDSKRQQRTSYRLEDTSVDFTFGVRPLRILRFGVSGGHRSVNTGPGQRSGASSIEEIFSPETTPGIDEQPDFFRGSVFAEIDYRDSPGGARSGGYYGVKFISYKDNDFRRYSHRRLDLDFQQFIPYFNKRRTLALRYFSVLSFENPNQRVPFYLQPTLGSSHDLRGFRRYRYHDDNSVHFSVEHRWESFSGLDAAIFLDAGKVVPKRSQLNFEDLELSYGFGFRFNARNDVFMRIDTAFSREGFMFWWTWGRVFKPLMTYRR